MDLVQELKARGLIEHSSADIEKILGSKRTVYLGIDPSSDSPQIGNLAVILLMKRLGAAGHKLVFLVGGGTGMIGDPREKGERSLLDAAALKKNTAGLKTQLKRVLAGTSFKMVDNATWLLKLDLFTFLRDIGKHFTVNDLIKRDIIRKRLETPDESISYTEFSYALLQGYDYLMLNKKYGVDLQIGGTDQWTNILSGVDLVRKKEGKEVYAFTLPLITDSAGKKFGKSEGNAVWIDPNKTSPFAFYQFWLSVPDDVVEKYLKVYTFMPLAEIGALAELHARNPERRQAQKLLAKQVTEIVHGKEEAERAERFTEVLFGSAPADSLSAADRAALAKAVPSLTLAPAEAVEGVSLVEVLTRNGFVNSKTEARRLLEGKGIKVNGEVATPEQMLVAADLGTGMAVIQKGKSEKLLVFKGK